MTGYEVDDLVVDIDCARVSRSGAEIPLPKLSFDFLLVLIELAPKIATIDTLMSRVWPGLVVSPETVSQRAKLLRDALGDDPKQPRYIAGVRGRGYRLVANVIAWQPNAPAPISNTKALPAVVTMPVTVRRPYRWTAISLAALLIIVAAITLWRVSRDSLPSQTQETPTPTSSAPLRSVAVLPFENLSTAPGGDALALGLAETLLHQFASLRDIDVIARTSSFAFKSSGADARKIGQQLNARYLLEGSVQQESQRLRVTAQLIDAETGVHVWSMRFDRSPQDIFAVQDEIAMQVARALKLSLDARATDQLTRQGTADFNAYLEYLQGRALLASGRIADMKAAKDHFDSAIKLDPSFAAAYVSLANTAVQLAEFDVTSNRQSEFARAVDRARALIDRALELDSRYAPAYIERAYLKAFSDLKGAEADYRYALEISPNYASGYEGLASILYEDPLRRNDALAMIDRARRLDPLQPRYDVLKAVFLFYGKDDPAGARDLLTGVLEHNPLYQPALTRLAEIYWAGSGELAAAARLAEKALALDPQSDWTRRVLTLIYLTLNERAAAADVVSSAPTKIAAQWVAVRAAQHDWQRAAEAAYTAVDTATTSPIDVWISVEVISLHAHATGQYEHAIATFEKLGGVTWEPDGTPVLHDQLGLQEPVIGLADMLLATDQSSRAQALLKASLAEMDRQTRQLGRSDRWFVYSRAAALALLGDSDGAIRVLQKATAESTANTIKNHLWSLEFDPAFASLRSDPRFISLLADAKAQAAAQRKELDRLRAEGLVPNRKR